jgi:GDP-4-dehydro-6-deoxy-D-mannose reductase
MRTLVTGVSGFVGHYLFELLLKRKHQVFGIGHTTPDSVLHFVKGLTLFKTDLRDAEGLKSDMKTSRPDQVYHLGGIASVKRFDTDLKNSFEINTVGSLNLFEAARAGGLKGPVVLISSAEVYGTLSKKDVPVRETQPVNPCNFYGVSKASAEFFAANYWKNYGTKVITLRPFNHIGPGQAADFVTASFAKQIAEIKRGKREPVIEVGNLKSKRDFTDVRDIVDAYHTAAAKCAAGEVYNVCSGRMHEVGEILERLTAIAGVKLKVKRAKDRLRRVDITYVCGCPDKFMRKTGWRPRYAIEDTLKDLLDYWMERV